MYFEYSVSSFESRKVNVSGFTASDRINEKFGTFLFNKGKKYSSISLDILQFKFL